MEWVLVLVLVLFSSDLEAAQRQTCFDTSVMAPSPFMGNHGEVFRTTDGSIFEVCGSYEYMYAYYPSVTVCPAEGKMLVEGKVVGIRTLKPASREVEKNGEGKKMPSGAATARVNIVLRVQGCDYFIADGPKGYYLLEWYGGYDPDKGDRIFGDLGGYGFKDIVYDGGQEGRVYVDDYLLSKSSALEK